MMKIEFRAWDKREKIMGEVNYIRFFKSQYTQVSVRFKKNGKVFDDWYAYGQEDGSDNIILMQYTGMKDEDYKKIYKADILKDSLGNLYIVDFIRGCFYLKTRYEEKNGEWLEWLPMSEITQLAEPENFYRIGNIYENPELLVNKVVEA